jgi:hypothetical protein
MLCHESVFSRRNSNVEIYQPLCSVIARCGYAAWRLQLREERPRQYCARCGQRIESRSRNGKSRQCGATTAPGRSGDHRDDADANDHASADAYADNAYYTNEASSASRHAANDADDQDHAKW